VLGYLSPAQFETGTASQTTAALIVTYHESVGNSTVSSLRPLGSVLLCLKRDCTRPCHVGIQSCPSYRSAMRLAKSTTD